MNAGTAGELILSSCVTTCSSRCGAMFPAAEAKAAQQHDAAVEKRRSGSGHSPPGAAEPRGQNPRTPAGGAAGAANNRPRKFLKPGRVQQFWSRIVGDSKGHKTSLLGFSSGRAGGSRGHENPAPAAGDGKDYPRNLADLSAYLRQPNKCAESVPGLFHPAPLRTFGRVEERERHPHVPNVTPGGRGKRTEVTGALLQSMNRWAS